jgi:hypothetical protein
VADPKAVLNSIPKPTVYAKGAMMNQHDKRTTDEPREHKQPYSRPELLKHGKVENLTQQAAPPPNGISQPPITQDPV